MFAVLKNVCLFVVVCAVLLPVPVWVALDALQKGKENSNKTFTVQIWVPKNAEVHAPPELVDVTDWLTKENGKDFSGPMRLPFYQYQEDFTDTTNRHLVAVSPGFVGTILYWTVLNGQAFVSEANVKTPAFVKFEKTEYIAHGTVKYTTGEIAYFPIVCVTIILGLIADIIIGGLCLFFSMFLTAIYRKITGWPMG